MIGKRVESYFPPGFSVERRDLIQRKQVTLGSLASVEVQQDHWLAVTPWRRVLLFGGGAVQLEGSISSEFHRLWREQSRSLMMSVARVHAPPAVNHKVWAKSADHADHVLEDLVAPDPFRFFGRLRIAKIFGSRKIEPHAVAPCCRQQFLRPDQSQLRRLLGAEVVLTTLAAR